MQVQVVDIGIINYARALKLQEKIQKLRQEEKIMDTMLLLEHPPVITQGRNSHKENILVPEKFLKERGIELFEINRGGDVTMHCPGQIVGYPIMDLKNHGKDIHLYMYNLEEIFVHLLQIEYGIEAGRDPKNRGTWIDKDKITAVGCSVKKWVSMHGFAFNVNTDLSYFDLITPCGIKDKGVTSLQKILGRIIDLETVKEQVISSFVAVFGVDTVRITENDLLDIIGGYDDEN